MTKFGCLAGFLCYSITLKLCTANLSQIWLELYLFIIIIIRRRTFILFSVQGILRRI